MIFEVFSPTTTMNKVRNGQNEKWFQTFADINTDSWIMILVMRRSSISQYQIHDLYLHEYWRFCCFNEWFWPFSYKNYKFHNNSQQLLHILLTYVYNHYKFIYHVKRIFARWKEASRYTRSASGEMWAFVLRFRLQNWVIRPSHKNRASIFLSGLKCFLCIFFAHASYLWLRYWNRFYHVNVLFPEI